MSHLPVPQGSLSTYLVEINRFPLLSAKDEGALARRYRDTGDIEAAHQLVTSNLRFVVKIAYEYRSYGLRMADLVQEGNIGLMMAVKKFDPDKGFRFISYAVWWIRAMIQNFILKSWSLVKIGTTQAQRKLFYKLRQAKKAITGFLSDPEALNDEGYSQVARNLKVRNADVVEMDSRLRARDASLDQPLSTAHGGQATLMDHLANPAANQEDLLVRSEEGAQVRVEIAKALSQLNEKERFIVEKRLMTDEPMTLREIGDQYHISRERARQLEERTKKKIRSVLAEAGMTGDLA